MSGVTVGVVVPSLVAGGGVSALARFICDAIERSDDFALRLFSVPSSARDPSSVRLAAPGTWLRGPVEEEGTWDGHTYRHVGSVLAELEFQRYRPRPALTRRLRACDLIQVISGTPAWGVVAAASGRPLVLMCATLAAMERRERFRQESGVVTLWRRLMTKVTRRMDRMGVGLADRVLVLNRCMEEVARRWTDPDRVVLAPPGVDLDLFRPAPPGGEAERKYVLSVGRFDDHRKNVRLLFEAYSRFRHLVDDPPDLVLVGRTGPRREDWMRARALGIRDHVRFHRDVARSRLVRIYRNASVFALSSSEEGLGLVILEAMASGVPVVCTATEGALHVVSHGETGLLVPPRDSIALGSAMARVWDDESLRSGLGRKGRIRAEEHFGADAASRPVLEAYRAVIESPGRGHVRGGASEAPSTS